MPITRRTSARVGPWDLLLDGKRIDRSNNKAALQGRAAAMRRVYRKHGVKGHTLRIVPASGPGRTAEYHSSGSLLGVRK